jgi:cytochrome c-type biogenesis protein
MPTVTHAAAIFAGLLSFLSPCILPMVPFYLSWMAGKPVGRMQSNWPLIWRALAFSCGVILIFVLLGSGATFLGGLLGRWYDPLSWIAGAGLVIMGLHGMGVITIPVLNRQMSTTARPDPLTIAGAFLTGLAFGFAWTPCVGPVLATILLLAGGTGDATLLISYGFGMTAPFIVAAAFLGPVMAWLARHRARLIVAQRITGAAMVLFGVLLATGGVQKIAEWMLNQMDWTAVLAGLPVIPT